MRRERDDAQRIRAVVAAAHADRIPLAIVGSGSKAFFGRKAEGSLLSIADHVGIVDYRPSELVITARAGTPLAEIEHALAAERQMLPFEPPQFAGGGTLGGAVATGFSGPARPWCGSVRDAVLGIEIVNGEGKRLEFGGRVMKNVAGYDVSRLMVGAFGTLGVLLSVSLRVAPRYDAETTCVQSLDRDAALRVVVDLGRRAEPVTATCHVDGKLHVRFAGATPAVHHAVARFGGERSSFGADLWRTLRDHVHPFFRRPPVWRLSVPPAAPFAAVAGDWLTGWGGAERWLSSEAPAAQIREAARLCGGYATGFHGVRDAFQPLPEGALRYHQRLKQAFDPAAILNRSRMYAEL